MTIEPITTRSDIGITKYCQCGRQLIGGQEKESGICSYCAWPGGDTMTDIRIGDARNLIKEIPDKTFDCVMTSPPYNE